MIHVESNNFMSVKEVNKKLNEGLEKIINSDRFKEMLKIMSRFHNYSLNNTILIMLQRESATMVKGYKGWQELGRYVNKGEKAIRILAPIYKKVEVEKIDPVTNEVLRDPEGNKITEKRDMLAGFKMVSVFDIEQTSGKDIPSVRDFINRDLKNDDSIRKLYYDFFQHIKDHYGYNIREDETEKGVGGYYNPTKNEIVISTNNNKNETEKFRVLIHEFAHAKLHNLESNLSNLPRGHKEAQAEATAYIVCNYYGLDTDDISLGYIATWASDLDLARQAVIEIQKISSQIIETLDELQRDKIQEFYKLNESAYENVAHNLKHSYGVDLESLDKTGKEVTQFEILQKSSGIVLSGKLEYSSNNDNFIIRTNRNMIVPLSELDQNGNYLILNKELEKNQLVEVSSYQRVPDQFEVIEYNGKFAVVTQEGKDIISKEYANKDEAQHFLNRMALSQSLHQQSFLKSQLKNDAIQLETKERLNALNYQINYDVSKYLSNEEKRFIPKENHGATIGWTLIKNPNIRTFDDLYNYAFNKTKYIPSHDNLRQAITNSLDDYEKNMPKRLEKDVFVPER